VASGQKFDLDIPVRRCPPPAYAVRVKGATPPHPYRWAPSSPCVQCRTRSLRSVDLLSCVIGNCCLEWGHIGRRSEKVAGTSREWPCILAQVRGYRYRQRFVQELLSRVPKGVARSSAARGRSKFANQSAIAAREVLSRSNAPRRAPRATGSGSEGAAAMEIRDRGETSWGGTPGSGRSSSVSSGAFSGPARKGS
jgi:hypothetical protein